MNKDSYLIKKLYYVVFHLAVNFTPFRGKNRLNSPCHQNMDFSEAAQTAMHLEEMKY